MIGPSVAALITDVVCGEPPVRVHPTVWMGRWLARGRARRRAVGPMTSLVEGAAIVGLGVLASTAVGYVVERGLHYVPHVSRPWDDIAMGVALKPALSLRPLLTAARDVRIALQRQELDEARRLLAEHLVSRDTRELSVHEIAGAAIESVAENLNDSIVAPLLAFRAGGLGAAYAYRMVNTADAMFGYRTPELEWFGKAAARMDDIAGYIPARLSAFLIACTAWMGNGSSREAFRVARRDARCTTSPNAGWPMAAMAGALGVQLTKRDVYVLNPNGRAALPFDIARATRIVAGAAGLAALLADVC